MTLDEAYIQINNFVANHPNLNQDSREACEIGADAIREKTVKYEKEIKKEFVEKIHDSIDIAYQEIASKYSVANNGIGISDDMQINDYVGMLAETLAEVLVNDIIE